MYMNGRGPMMGGHRGGPGFSAPTRHGPGMGARPMMGYVPGMGFRPMRVHRRPTGFFPMGGFFILPALMIGGWIAIAVLAGALSLAGSIIGGIFSGLSSLTSDAFSGETLAIGIVIGLAAYFVLRNRKARKEESTGTVDGEAVGTEIAEPTADAYRMND